MFKIIFILAAAIRIILALVNRDMNDDHLEVILRIINNLPVGRLDCWECFQPKLYYYSVIYLGNFFDIHKPEILLIYAQLLSAAAGIAALLILWKFLQEYNSKHKLISILTFALIALNPSLTGINAQGTNDSFVIFFGTLAIYSLWKYLQNNSRVYAMIVIFAAICATLSKGSGWAIFIGVSIVLILLITYHLIKKNPVKNMAIFFLLFQIIYFFAIIRFGPYLQYYIQDGTPFALNNFSLLRPGITSIYDGYFKFPFVDLITNPYITHSYYYFENRTSFWTLLYGQYNTMHYWNYPPSWQDTSAGTQNLTRAMLILALPLMLLFIFGFFVHLITSVIKIIQKSNIEKVFSDRLLFIIFFSIFFAMNLLYSFTYRDFSFIKSIFFLPVILPLMVFLHTGLSRVSQKIKKTKILIYFFVIYIMCLCFLYLYDTTLLIIQLESFLHNKSYTSVVRF